MTSQERDNACFVLYVSPGISGLKTRESPVVCQCVYLPDDSLLECVATHECFMDLHERATLNMVNPV